MIHNYQASTGVGIYNERLAIILGLLTLIIALSTFASCRSCLGILHRLGINSPLQNRSFQTFYKAHAYLWWTLWFILAMHLMVGAMHTASTIIPGDEDAYVHWQIIWAGVAGLGLIGGFVLTSCRSFSHTLDFLTNKPSMSMKLYRIFYRYHSYYWMIFILAALAHFLLGYFHAGIWPGAG
jgi:hypothetical protein